MKVSNRCVLNIFNCLLYVSCIYPISTLLLEGTIVNKILFFILVAIYFIIALQNGFKKITLLCLILLVINYCYAILVTKWRAESNTNMLFYYPFMVAYSCLFIDNKDSILNCILRNKEFLLFVIRLWSLIVGVSIFLPSCYYVKEGGALYFGSFAGGIFRLAPSALYIMSLILITMSLFNRKKDIIYMLIPMYCFFMGSSRTYLVSGLCLLIVAWYWYVGRKLFLKTSIPLALILFVIVWNSSLGEKIRYTLNDDLYGDFWFRITSSRSALWSTDLKGWFSNGWLNRLFGCGIFYTEQLTGLWAHNDFIELLCSFGIVGLVEYVFVQIILLKHFIGRKYKVPRLISFCVIMCWLFNAFFNMYYTYFCSLLSYPLILISVNYFYCNMKQINNYQLDKLNHSNCMQIV